MRVRDFNLPVQSAQGLQKLRVNKKCAKHSHFLKNFIMKKNQILKILDFANANNVPCRPPIPSQLGNISSNGKKIDRSRHPAPPVTSNFGAEVGPGGPRLAPISKQSVIGMPIKKEWAHTPTMQCTLKHFPGWWQLSPTFARSWRLLGGL